MTFAPLALLIGYFVLVFGLDGWWRSQNVYWFYGFEAVFVLATSALIRPKWILPKDGFWRFGLPVAAASGIAAYKVAGLLGISIPFDLSNAQTVLHLLVLAPILEELVFRSALWDLIQSLLKQEQVTLVLTSLAFAAGHFVAYFSVPEAFHGFILYQTIYVFLLALGLGLSRKASSSPLGSVLLHFQFNLGFFVASQI